MRIVAAGATAVAVGGWRCGRCVDDEAAVERATRAAGAAQPCAQRDRGRNRSIDRGCSSGRQEIGAQEEQQGQETEEEWEPEGEGEEAGRAERRRLRAWPVAAGRLLEQNAALACHRRLGRQGLGAWPVAAGRLLEPNGSTGLSSAPDAASTNETGLRRHQLLLHHRNDRSAGAGHGRPNIIGSWGLGKSNA